MLYHLLKVIIHLLFAHQDIQHTYVNITYRSVSNSYVHNINLKIHPSRNILVYIIQKHIYIFHILGL